MHFALRLTFIIPFILTILHAHAQQDSIWTKTGLTVGTIKEVNPETVKFVLPGEDIDQAVYRTDVLKIRYRTGREQVFIQPMRVKTVRDGSDYDSVGITKLLYDVPGLLPMDSMKVDLPLNTTSDNHEKVRRRAYRLMQAEAALHGYKMVRIIDPGTPHNILEPGTKKVKEVIMSFSGMSYTDTVPKMDLFMSRIGAKRTFDTYQLISMKKIGGDLFKDGFQTKLEIGEIKADGNAIQLLGTLKGINATTFRVIGYDRFAFTVAAKTEKGLVNIKAFF